MEKFENIQEVKFPDPEPVAEKPELLTEVTSIAQEEAKTGQKIAIPTEEELVAKHSQLHLTSFQHFGRLFKDLSAKQKLRVMLAVLDLPQDKIPVMLKTDAEKAAFVFGQQAISSRFVLNQKAINDAMRKQRAEQLEKLKQENQGETNVESK